MIRKLRLGLANVKFLEGCLIVAYTFVQYIRMFVPTVAAMVYSSYKQQGTEWKDGKALTRAYTGGKRYPISRFQMYKQNSMK